MASESLCVRVVFKGSRPSYDWVDYKSALFGVPGEWLQSQHEVNGSDSLVLAQPGGWVARWLCDGAMPPQYPPDKLDEALRHLRAVAEAIEEAWERENAPEVEPAARPVVDFSSVGLGPPNCRVCDVPVIPFKQETTHHDDPDNKFAIVRRNGWSCPVCGLTEYRQLHCPKAKT